MEIGFVKSRHLAHYLCLLELSIVNRVSVYNLGEDSVTFGTMPFGVPDICVNITLSIMASHSVRQLVNITNWERKVIVAYIVQVEHKKLSSSQPMIQITSHTSESDHGSDSFISHNTCF